VNFAAKGFSFVPLTALTATSVAANRDPREMLIWIRRG